MNTMKYLYGLSALLLSAALGSCAYESDTVVNTGGEKGFFTLNVTTGSVGDNTTRAATVISSDAALTDSKADAEKTVSSLVWGIYHAAADADQGKKVYSKKWETTGASQATFSQSGIEFDDGDLSFQADDDVLVAANLSNTALASYEAFATKTAFQQNKLGISQALTAGTDVLDPAKLPMFGTSTVTANSSVEFSSDVTVKHLVAKVTLNSLSVDFTSTGHTSATFKPLEVFLINVPDELTMEYDGTNYTPTGLTLANLYQGENYDWSAHASASKRVYADYLGTGTVYEETLDGTDAYSKRYSLYTMPYNFTETTVTYASDNTRLVIKGEYRPAGGDDAVAPMYYAVNLNNGAGDYKIKPNTHYKVTATIKGPGADNAYDAIPLYQNFTANVDYEDWTEEATTATIDNGGYQWKNTQRAAAIGDLLFSDGSWGTLDEMPGKTPVAIVFSTTTSAADQAAGYTNGYAIALKDVNNSQTMAWSTQTSYVVTGVTPALDISDASKLTAYVGSATYLDGRSETEAITSAGDYSASVYPAAYAAVTTYETEVAHPAGTSGWYLPSVGQQYEWIKVFGGISTAPDQWRSTYKDCYWSGAASATATAFNNAAKGYLKTADGTTVDHSTMWMDIIGSGGYYWASTESAYGAGYAFDLDFGTNGNLYLDGSTTKSSTNLRVRAVLAF